MLEFWSAVICAKVKKLRSAGRLEPVSIMQKEVIEGPVFSRSFLPVCIPAFVSYGRDFMRSWEAGAAWGGYMGGCVED